MPLRLCVFLLAGLLALLSPLQARPLYIVAIGASNTSGLGVGEQNAYPAVLERLLRQKGIDAVPYKRDACQTPEVSEVSKQYGSLYERRDWLADEAVRYEPVSPCKFGKSREVLTKCRERGSAAPLKTVRMS